MARAPRLVVIEPGGVRREVSITQSPFRIGRQAGNEVMLRDSRISRQQAQILTANGTYILEDLGSRHGTYVNGQKVVRQQLAPKDTIDFGMADSYRMIFLGEGATVEELIERVETPAPSQSGSRELYHLGVLLEVARTLGTGLSLEDVLTSVVDAAIQITRTERGVLLLANASGELQASVARDSQRGTLRGNEVQISSSLLSRVVKTRRELIVSDTGQSPISTTESVARLELHTVIAIPVEKLPMIEALDATITTRQGELLGVLYLDSHKASEAYSDLDREVLRTLAREAATVIENARLFAASRAKARLDHEIEIASQIQKHLLPKSFPDLPSIEIIGSTLACLSVGGDCFDVFELSGGRHGFFIGDVSGKGISAALIATLLQGVFYTTAALDIPVVEVVKRVNNYLCERSGEERYATLFYGVVDSATGEVEYVNAGHVTPLVRRVNGALEGLEGGNFPVGLFGEAEFTSSKMRLSPGDYLVIYTDGVTEASNVRNEMFEELRLRKIMQGYHGTNAAELSDLIQTGMREFTQGAPQADDITLMIVHYRANNG